MYFKTEMKRKILLIWIDFQAEVPEARELGTDRIPKWGSPRSLISQPQNLISAARATAKLITLD